MIPKALASLHEESGSRRTMTALVKAAHGPAQLRLTRVPEPECPPGKVKLEVAFTGVCGTDIHLYHDRFPSRPPVILGHEFAGTITEVGTGVTGLRPGDRVTVLGASTVICGKCEYCRQGYFMFCADRLGMGHGVDGSFTRYVVVRPDQAYKLPESVSFEEGALTEPFASAVQAVEELTPLSSGDTVLISGPGPIGLLCALLLVGRAKVIVAGAPQDELRLQLAAKLGADVVVNFSRDDLLATVSKETRGRGVDVALECAGTKESVVNCLHALRKLGRLIQVGIVASEVSLPYDLILFKQIQVYGSLGYSLKTWQRTLQILEQRKIRLTSLITHKLPLSRWREAFDLCESRRGIKVLLHYDETEG